jgi:tetratricopeptide (TPR) repeat protein
MIVSNPKLLKYSLLLLASLTLVVLAFVGIKWLYPRVMGLSYQIKGGKQLQAVLQTAGIAEEIACATEPLTNDALIQQLGLAVENLKKATKFFPGLAQAHLLLGRANCALGQYKNAVAAYETYTGLRPENPGGHAELGFAYESASSMLSLTNFGDDPLYRTQEVLISKEWLLAGISAAQCAETGNIKFALEERLASKWYQCAASLAGDNLSGKDAFFFAIASVLSNHRLLSISGSSISTYILTDTLTVPGKDLQWVLAIENLDLQYGDTLARFSPADLNVGVMWWAGRAIAFIQISEPAEYQVTISVINNTSVPMDFQVEHNYVPLEKFSLNAGDGQRHEFQTNLHLLAGVHIIGINFPQDIGDLMIEALEFTKIE